jgi:putative hemolysin
MTPQILATATSRATAPSYSILVAGTRDEVNAAQRLRHLVFAEELGAKLHSPVAGFDIDEFDSYCDHLLIREDRTGEVVGTYRMLRPERARALGRLYADGEFDLSGLVDLRDAIVEAGRSCVHPDHRTGAVINLMWTGIARYLYLHGHRAPPRLRTAPRTPYPLPAVPTSDRASQLAAVPPLLRGYLRLGAWIGGEPAYDSDFGVADYFVLLSLDRLDQRYLRHFGVACEPNIEQLLGEVPPADGSTR